LISKADRGNSLVVTYQDEYNQKVMKFISNYNFTVAINDITKNSNEISETPLTNAKKSYIKTLDGST